MAAVVASLKAQSRPPDEIVVVDNGAPEGDPLQRIDGVRVESPPRNLGFGAGCNVGAAVAPGDALIFLNADVVLSRRALEAMMHRLALDEQIGAVGPRIMSGGELQLSARAFPSLRTGLLGRRSRLTALLVRARRYPTEFRRAYGQSGPVDWVSGAAMMLRHEAFVEVGGFDEGYWMYWEDADLCRRLRDRGWQVWFERDALVHHATGASGTTERTIRAFHESASRFASRHLAGSPVERRLIQLALRARCWLTIRSFRRRGVVR